jgi:hypothetical protein
MRHQNRERVAVVGKRRSDLSREEWQSLAAELKKAVEALEQCDVILSKTLTVNGMRPHRKAFGGIQSLRSRLDNLASSQHPDWPEATRLFYGHWTYHSEW